MPSWPDGWLLGRPDLIVRPAESFTLQAQPADAFRIFAIPVPVARRSYVRGIEFHPGNARRSGPGARSFYGGVRPAREARPDIDLPGQ